MGSKRNARKGADMKIATIGRGNVGGGLADLWERAGHEVQRIGKDGGDVSGADAVLLAVPSGAIDGALESVSGLEGKTLIDATNLVQGDRPEGFDSLAAYVKDRSGAHVAKSFNSVFARLYDRLSEQQTPPSCLFCGDDEAKETTAQLIRDAGYEPADAGGLENARALEELVSKLWFPVAGSMGQFFYRLETP
jgi:8-hydroxy-5-deazaflavin:NADPH oxidoreductase